MPDMSDQPTGPSRRNPWSRKKDENQEQHPSGSNRPPATPGGGMDPRQRWITIAWVVGALALILVFQTRFGPTIEDIRFSRFLTLVEDEELTEVDIGTTSISGTYADGDNERNFSTTIPPAFETTQLVNRLQRQDVAFTGQQPSFWTQFLISILPFLIIAGLFYFFFIRRMRQQLGGSGGPLSLGKNKAKLYDRTDMKTTFSDVAGVDEVETELQELVEYLKRPEKFREIGARIPKGVLLVGPPGTGKTLLARAIAGEAEVPFFYISASEFIELFVGLGAARVRDLFQQARQRAPAIVFIDEIDSIGQARAGAAGPQMGSHQEQEQTLQQLLTEMDGFEPNSGVIIVAASNRPEVLDQALLRPGRFDRQIQVNLPDIQRARGDTPDPRPRREARGRCQTSRSWRAARPASRGRSSRTSSTRGPSWQRGGRNKVEMHDLEEAIDRVIAGLERRSQVLSEDERRLVAYHELGHALVARFVEHSDPVHRVSIIPRGIGAARVHTTTPGRRALPDVRARTTRSDRRPARRPSGRGDRVRLRDHGGQDDLMKATEIARRMVMEFGMSEVVGPINIAERGLALSVPGLPSRGRCLVRDRGRDRPRSEVDPSRCPGKGPRGRGRTSRRHR